MPGKILPAFRPEQHANLFAACDFVAENQVVRVAVTNRDANTIADDGITFSEAKPHAPAKEQADVISFQPVVPNDGSL